MIPTDNNMIRKWPWKLLWEKLESYWIDPNRMKFLMDFLHLKNLESLGALNSSNAEGFRKMTFPKSTNITKWEQCADLFCFIWLGYFITISKLTHISTGSQRYSYPLTNIFTTWHKFNVSHWQQKKKSDNWRKGYVISRKGKPTILILKILCSVNSSNFGKPES